jgi:high-affinity Fe2+/Pb2+ permease
MNNFQAAFESMVNHPTQTGVIGTSTSGVFAVAGNVDVSMPLLQQIALWTSIIVGCMTGMMLVYSFWRQERQRRREEAQQDV